MKLGDYELRIPEGKETDGGYVALKHGQRYTVFLGNHSEGRCDVELQIDGTVAGLFRLEAGQKAKLERPVHDDGHFTFFELVTAEAKAAGLKATSEIGLVKAIFKPEDMSPRLYSSPGVLYQEQQTSDDLVPGGTGLSGRSKQTYGSARKLFYVSDEDFVTIHLRLGGQKQEDIRPLAAHPKSNPIPPPLT